MTINKGKLLKSVGWATVGLGLYLVGLGVAKEFGDGYSNFTQPDDNIIDADFTIIND